MRAKAGHRSELNGGTKIFRDGGMIILFDRNADGVISRNWDTNVQRGLSSLIALFNLHAANCDREGWTKAVHANVSRLSLAIVETPNRGD